MSVRRLQANYSFGFWFLSARAAHQLEKRTQAHLNPAHFQHAALGLEPPAFKLIRVFGPRLKFCSSTHWGLFTNDLVWEQATRSATSLRSRILHTYERLFRDTSSFQAIPIPAYVHL